MPERNRRKMDEISYLRLLRTIKRKAFSIQVMK